MPIPTLDGQARAFADACIDMNTADELIEALHDGPDEDDCRTWQITADEWRAAVATALRDGFEHCS